MERNKFISHVLVCKKSIGKFKKGHEYKLSITLSPNIYVSYEKDGSEFSEEMTEEELFSHFAIV